MELTYKNEGDYLIPNLIYTEETEDTLTKYGMLRETFLKNNHKGIYSGKLLKGTLKAHCIEIQRQAEERAERIINQLMQKEGVTEELKAADQMEWVRRMNSINNRADEIVLNEIVYSL
ncbi:MAG: TnpV protein [Lachnospiraceae bacterium]|nr:TnpV protein [Lachnospiraceae bacterium]